MTKECNKLKQKRYNFFNFIFLCCFHYLLSFFVLSLFLFICVIKLRFQIFYHFCYRFVLFCIFLENVVHWELFEGGKSQLLNIRSRLFKQQFREQCSILSCSCSRNRDLHHSLRNILYNSLRHNTRTTG
jgi:hypothetical protein